MQIPSVNAEAVLNTMRLQIARLQPQNAQQEQQIQAQTSRQLSTLEASTPGLKGSNLDVTA